MINCVITQVTYLTAVNCIEVRFSTSVTRGFLCHLTKKPQGPGYHATQLQWATAPWCSTEEVHFPVIRHTGAYFSWQMTHVRLGKEGGSLELPDASPKDMLPTKKCESIFLYLTVTLKYNWSIAWEVDRGPDFSYSIYH